MRKAYTWLASTPQHRSGVVALQIAIGLAYLFRAATEAPFASFLWGPSGLGHGRATTWLGPLVGGFFDLPFTTERGTLLIVVLLGIGAAGLVLQISTWSATILTLTASSMLSTRLPDLGDGGDNVAHLALIYLCFALPRSVTRPGPIRTWLHNIAVLAIGAQLAILYFTSGFMKTGGPVWQNGTALYAISQVEWFSTPLTREWFKNSIVVTGATYATLLFQLWFPIALFTPFRVLFVAIGIAFHLGIALSMGLVTFSTVMIGLELFLLPDATFERAGLFLRTRIAGIHPQWLFRAPQPARAMDEHVHF